MHWQNDDDGNDYDDEKGDSEDKIKLIQTEY